MKSLMLAVAVAVVFCVSSVQAGQPATAGHVSTEMLSQLGLGGMQPMSDAQGMEIRGKFYVRTGNISLNLIIENAPFSNNVQQISGRGSNVNVQGVIVGGRRGGGGSYPH